MCVHGLQENMALCSVISMLPTFNRGKLLAWERKERTIQSKKEEKRGNKH